MLNRLWFNYSECSVKDSRFRKTTRIPYCLIRNKRLISLFIIMLHTVCKLHLCWWRMLETKCVGHKFEMLVTDLLRWKNHPYNKKVTKIMIHSSLSESQRHNDVTNITIYNNPIWTSVLTVAYRAQLFFTYVKCTVCTPALVKICECAHFLSSVDLSLVSLTVNDHWWLQMTANLHLIVTFVWYNFLSLMVVLAPENQYKWLIALNHTTLKYLKS